MLKSSNAHQVTDLYCNIVTYWLKVSLMKEVVI